MIRLLQNAPIVPAMMFLGAIVGWCYVLFQLVLTAIASRWPIADGEIVGSYMIQQGLDARGLSERVTYRYSVNGQPFVNDRVRIGPQPQRGSIIPATGYPIATSMVAQRYPVGQPVPVRYNPRRPQESVLHAQPNLPVFVLFAAAAVGLYLGARGVFWPR